MFNLFKKKKAEPTAPALFVFKRTRELTLEELNFLFGDFYNNYIFNEHSFERAPESLKPMFTRHVDG